MAPGCRSGFVTKEALVARLASSVPQGATLKADKTSARVILGHAIFHNVVTAKEIDETTDRVETTLPCYLFSYVENPMKRQAIEAYVLAASQLYRRGTVLANLMAMEMLEGHTDIQAGSRPKFDAESSAPFGQLADLYLAQDVRNSEAKQVFLPERWPTDTVRRDPRLDAVLAAYGDRVPRLPAWEQVMPPTGWDNAINRMATKFVGNIKVQAMKNLLDAVLAYIGVVSLHCEDSRDAIAQVIKGRLRPLAIHAQDWEMVYRLRSALGVQDECVTDYTPKNTAFSRDVFLLHLFLVKFGDAERTYLPVSTRGRKYCYLDNKVTSSLFAEAVRQANKRRREMEAVAKAAAKAAKKAAPRRKRGDPPAVAQRPPPPPPPPDGEASGTMANMEDDTTTSVGELLGLTEEGFKRHRTALRKVLRRQSRRAHRAERPGQRKQRLAKARRRWANLGTGCLPKGSRIDSVETDGVGLRLCVKTKIDMTPYVCPVPVVTEASTSTAGTKQAKKAQKKDKHARGLPATPYFTPVDATDTTLPKPIVVGVDTGRAKLFAAAVSRSAIKKPTSVVFTRHRYYHEMEHMKHRKWDLARREQNPELTEALLHLSQSGGIRNCDPDKWTAYLEADRDHDAVLDAEYVSLVERARWRMRMFRNKRRSLDKAVKGMIDEATAGERMDRPLVFGIGDGGFPSTGPGELPAPTSALSVAFQRGLRREAKRGRNVVVLVINEFRTTMCCCACGCVTSRPQVEYRDKEGARQRKASHRLRACTTCETTGKLRDRDVQAARNISWLTYHMYYGLERPEYMRRS